MEHRALDEVYCSVARTWAVLGDRWTTLLLREAFHGTACLDSSQFQLQIGRPPVGRCHMACGEEAGTQLVCGHCARPVTYGDLRAEYAPGAW